MGYYMDMQDCDFFVAKEDFDHLAEAVRGMLGDVDDVGGGWDGKQKTYSWVTNSELENADTAAKAFKAWRWEPEYDEDGNINSLSFWGEKLGDDEFFFQTIAPWVKDGSYVEMRGEDSSLWRWTFNDGEMKEITPEIKW